MKGWRALKRTNFPVFSKSVESSGTRWAIHSLCYTVDFFVTNLNPKKRVKIWMIQDIRDYCVEEGQQVTYKRFANATKIVAVQTKKKQKNTNTNTIRLKILDKFESGAVVASWTGELITQSCGRWRSKSKIKPNLFVIQFTLLLTTPRLQNSNRFSTYNFIQIKSKATM